MDLRGRAARRARALREGARRVPARSSSTRARARCSSGADPRRPLRILSDGFDWNLERLQSIHRVHFDFMANHLEYEGDVWRISPGRPNPACGCGTGSCKRGIISAYRAANPGAFCVHIGNGRVSDLCGALGPTSPSRRTPSLRRSRRRVSPSSLSRRCATWWPS
ncbi:MAG: hypothetical protein R3E53_11600 [Myxococcota bacterium]